jgi:hypothetical protein
MFTRRREFGGNKRRVAGQLPVCVNKGDIGLGILQYLLQCTIAKRAHQPFGIQLVQSVLQGLRKFYGFCLRFEHFGQ